MQLNKKILFSCFMILVLLCGCGESESKPSEKGNGTRDNTPVVLEPQASQTKTIGNNKIIFDLSHEEEGYVVVKYQGDNPKVKVRIKNPNSETLYTYDINEGDHVFPLTGGNGEYTFMAFENLYDDKYSQLFSEKVSIQIKDEYTPYLYPNQYVNFNKDSLTVKKGQEIAKGADTDLDVVSYVFDYIINNIHYDYDKADSVKNGNLSGYIPNVDEILDKGEGICFDYAAVMATMLRSQNIPTKMTFGYVAMESGSVYHAWISVYIKDVGWVDDLIEFDGKNWSMMDPTLISDGNNSSKIRDFTKNKDNYTITYLY